MIISTGKADWVKEVTDENGSLAQLLCRATSDTTDEPSSSSGTYFPPSEPTTHIEILNSSHTSEDDGKHRVLILPDYKVVTHIPADEHSAQKLYQSSISPNVGRIGSRPSGEDDTMFSYPLPYACVILLCEYTTPCPLSSIDLGL